MSSVTAVQSLSRELGALLHPHDGWKKQVSAIHRKLTDENFPWSIDVTWNRVKSWYFAEARRIDWEERVALEQLKAIEEAQRDHKLFVATTTRLAAALAAEGAALTSRQMAVLESIAGERAGVPGNPDARQGSRTVSVAGARGGR